MDSLGSFIRGEGNPFVHRRYLRRLADVVSLSEADLERYIWRSQRRAPTPNRRAPTTATTLGASPLSSSNLEEHCLSLLLRHTELRESGLDISPDYFEQSENRDIFTKWAACATIEETAGSLSTDLTEHLQTLLGMENPPLNIKERERDLQAVVNRLKERYFKVQEQALMEQLEEADWKDISSLSPSLNQAREINQQLKELFSGPNPTNT